MKVWIIFLFSFFATSLWANSERNCAELLTLSTQELSIRTLIQSYTERLVPFENPFAFAYHPEQGKNIFRTLSVRNRNEKPITSPLAVINFVLKRAYSKESKLNQKLVAWLIAESTNALDSEQVDRTELQSNLLALKYALEYLRRFKIPEEIVDRNGEKQSVTKNSNPTPPQKQNQVSNQSSAIHYPSLPREYKPTTKNTENVGGNSGQAQVRISEVNFKTPFFAQRYYSDVQRHAPHPFRESELPIFLPELSRYEPTQHELILTTLGEQHVDLFLPPRFKPLMPSDPRIKISRSKMGGYSLENKDLLPEIHIPLVEDTNILMLPHVLEHYTREVGFRNKEWPQAIQLEILRKFTKADAAADPLKVSQAVANHLATEYLYSVGEKPETDPIDALNSGAFQCDIAALSMIGILRDVYQIPSRVVAGFRAKKYQNGKDGKSYLILPGDAHAWVEVFYDGKWHVFDPTPIKKDKKENKQKEKNEYADHELENTPKSNERPKQLETENKTFDQSSPKHHNTSSDRSLTKEDLIQQLELGSLEIQPQIERNTLLERTIRILLQNALNPTQRGIEIQNQLNQISSVIKQFHSTEALEIFQKALSVHTVDHPDLKNWIDQLVRLMPSQDVNQSYQNLHQMITSLELYSKLLDPSGLIAPPSHLLENLKQAKAKLATLEHPDAQDIGLVQDLVKTLPPVARLLLKNDFDLSIVGPNNPTREVAKNLKTGRLNDLRLISNLSPMADFILNSTPRPETTEIKTWQQDQARRQGRDLLPSQRPGDLYRMILGQPGKTIEQNMSQGTAYVTTRKKRVRIPTGYTKQESERVTIVLYDTSGSMHGNPGRFQAALISAFVSKALSDLSPSGRHRHRVLLVPFDDEPRNPTRVTNSQEALDVIRDYRKTLENTGGGTNIQKALMQAMSLIADAERRSGEPLAAANIVLMTDGIAEINPDELSKARLAIDRQTPLQTMFVAINQTNEELMRFAMESNKIGSERGFYREFSAEQINSYLNKADTLDLNRQAHFYTEKTAKEIPQDVFEILGDALRQASDFSSHIHRNLMVPSAKEHLENLEKIKWRDIPQMDRPLERWIVKVRRLVKHRSFQEGKVLDRVIDDLVTHFEKLTGIPLNEMSDYEIEQLRHLIRFAAGYEDASK